VKLGPRTPIKQSACRGHTTGPRCKLGVVVSKGRPPYIAVEELIAQAGAKRSAELSTVSVVPVMPAVLESIRDWCRGPDVETLPGITFGRWARERLTSPGEFKFMRVSRCVLRRRHLSWTVVFPNFLRRRSLQRLMALPICVTPGRACASACMSAVCWCHWVGIGTHWESGDGTTQIVVSFHTLAEFIGITDLHNRLVGTHLASNQIGAVDVEQFVAQRHPLAVDGKNQRRRSRCETACSQTH